MFFLFAWRGGKRAFRAGKMLFQMAQTQQRAEAKQETQGNVTGARTGSGQLPQAGQATAAGPSPGAWLFPGVLGMAQPRRAGLDIQVALSDHRQVIFKPP